MHKTIQIIRIPIYIEENGTLLAVQEQTDLLPFNPLRTFIIYDVPSTKKRAGHAVDCELFILAIRGEVTILHSSSIQKSSSWLLLDNGEGLYVPPLHFVELKDFSEGSIVMVFASKKYEETRYFTFDEIPKEFRS